MVPNDEVSKSYIDLAEDLCNGRGIKFSHDQINPLDDRVQVENLQRDPISYNPSLVAQSVAERIGPGLSWVPLNIGTSRLIYEGKIPGKPYTEFLKIAKEKRDLLINLRQVYMALAFDNLLTKTNSPQSPPTTLLGYDPNGLWIWELANRPGTANNYASMSMRFQDVSANQSIEIAAGQSNTFVLRLNQVVGFDKPLNSNTGRSADYVQVMLRNDAPGSVGEVYWTDKGGTDRINSNNSVANILKNLPMLGAQVNKI